MVLTNDPDDLIAELRKKYGASAEESKGVAQLARSIGAIAHREWTGSDNELAETNYVFPVLVVHDERVSYHGVSGWLAREFRDLLGTFEAKVLVRDLIILTVSDIENLSSSIKSFGFANCLRDYSAQVRNRDVSFHNWLYRSNYGKMIIAPQKLWDTLDEVMEAVKSELLPNGEDTEAAAAPTG